MPGWRLYERLPGWRLELLATHWPPTPRSRARADATTVPATATKPEWRSRPSAYYQLEMWRQVKRARSTTGGAQSGSAGGPKPRHQEPQVASPQVVRLCLRAGVCVYFGCAASAKRLYGGGTRAASGILQYTAVYCSILQYTAVYWYTAVYCSILRCFWIFFLFFGHWGVAGLADEKDETGSMHMCWITMPGAGAGAPLGLQSLLVLATLRLAGPGPIVRWPTSGCRSDKARAKLSLLT